MQDEHLLARKEEQRVKRRVGRPNTNPFKEADVEEDFGRRSHSAVDSYFDSSPDNQKKPFGLPEGVRMGKTSFWGFVFHYYTQGYDGAEIYPAEREYCPLYLDREHPLVENNLDHFLRELRKFVLPLAVGDRGATCKVITNLYEYKVNFLGDDQVRKSLAGSLIVQKYRRLYQVVLKTWYKS